MALPLERVSRLETITASAVQTVGDQRVMRYGDEIMPLVAIGDLVAERRSQPATPSPTGAAASLRSTWWCCIARVVGRWDWRWTTSSTW